MSDQNGMFMNLPLSRRGFLKIAGMVGPLFLFLGRIPSLFAGKWEHSSRQYWQRGHFRQENVDLSGYPSVIRARIEGHWDEYPIRRLSPEFIEWNTRARLKTLEEIEKGGAPSLAGPHSAAVASYGGGRKDSQVLINNAVKGLGCAPKATRLKEMIEQLRDTQKEPMSRKLEVLKSFYQQPDRFDWRKQISLELYTTPDFETHTFLNLMENPMVSIVFLDIPSFEIRAVARVVHPEDREAMPEELMLLEYTNLAHSYFHGEFERLFPALIFYVIELFDNSPGRMRGVRVVPPLPAE